MNITVIRSARRTVSLQVTAEGLIVRAPSRAAKKEIDGIIAEKRDWIEKKYSEITARLDAMGDEPPLDDEEIRWLTKQAKEVIPERVAYYAPIVGVTYGRITIRSQRSRWGSCTAEGNLNFNCLLMLTPPEVADSVVVHELCHRLEMNHSDRFYSEVLRVLPDYRRRNKWLKENGTALMMKLRK